MALPDKTLDLKFRIDSTLIGGINSMGDIGIVSNEVDTTTFDSEDGFKEFILTVKEIESFDVGGFVVDEDAWDSLFDKAYDQEKHTLEIELRNGAKYGFDGYLQSLKETDKNVEGARTFNMTIRPTGKITYTKAEASV
jgi:hypothetical protein